MGMFEAFYVLREYEDVTGNKGRTSHLKVINLQEVESWEHYKKDETRVFFKSAHECILSIDHREFEQVVLENVDNPYKILNFNLN